jgi:hypothetical protein
MMEAVRTSETSVDNHFTRQYNPEDSSEQQRTDQLGIYLWTVLCVSWKSLVGGLVLMYETTELSHWDLDYLWLSHSLAMAASKSKSKAVPLHAMEALGGERKYSSYSFTTSALDGGEWSVGWWKRTIAPSHENGTALMKGLFLVARYR